MVSAGEGVQLLTQREARLALTQNDGHGSGLRGHHRTPLFAMQRRHRSTLLHFRSAHSENAPPVGNS